jgi:hypothetical protein
MRFDATYRYFTSTIPNQVPAKNSRSREPERMDDLSPEKLKLKWVESGKALEPVLW